MIYYQIISISISLLKYYEFQQFDCLYDTTQGGVIQPKNVVKYTGTEAALTQVNFHMK